ncbi:hypothetical protein CBR_g2830 [Chara braunii]|uniref:USP domain-containing protein n=1 Tax=Chara braunii TaxID=69332 RepID=A0A388KEA7_CHABU|nr:hypothetical protein CBR_g2830 [Chara braunii]|eukprot:GBG68283.1 hypothetical protein CBR_g2830 [Chara braunii]
MLKALYLQLIGGAQAGMNHLAATHKCTIAELHTHITWKEFEQLWFTRFMVRNVVKAAMNEVYTCSQGNMPTGDWTAKWQKIVTTPGFDLTFPNQRSEFFSRSCAGLRSALGNEYDSTTFQAILDRANLVIQTDDKAANERQSQTHYVAKQAYQRPTHNNAVISEETDDHHAAAASSGDGGIVAALPPKRPKRVRKNKATQETAATGAGQKPWTTYKITKEVYDLRQKYGYCLWCNGVTPVTAQCPEKGKARVYDILFKLTEERESKVREAANSLLMLLPTHPGMLADFQALTDVNTMEEAKVILDTLFGARSRLLYTLQVLDGILMPVNRPVTEKTHRFRNYFMNFGGFPYVLAVFQHKALPKSVDDQTRRGCYASALRLLKFLIRKFMPFSETSKHQDIGAVPGIGGTGGKCLIRADGTVVVERSKEVANEEVTSITENSNGAIETDVRVVAEKTDKVDDPDRDGANEEHCKTGMTVEEDGASVMSQDSLMEQVVACLTRLTWATALGQISAMGVDGPVSAVIQKPCQQMKGDSTGGQPMEGSEDINHEDAYLCYEAMDLLVVCLGMKKSLMTTFFSSDLVQQFIVDMVLHSPDEGIRYKAAENFLQLSSVPVSSSEKVPLAHKYVLAALLGAKEEANKQPRQCIHYWELLCRLLCGIHGQEEKEMAEKQMMDEIKWLQSAPTVIDEKNKLLEGHLLLIRTLVEVLDCRIIGSSRCPGGRGLVEQLLKQFLFPEAVVLMATRGEGGALDLTGLGSGIVPGNIHFGQLGSNLEENGFLHAKCGTRSSRMSAFELLVCLGTHCLDNMREIVDLLLRMHFTSEIPEWEHLPSYGRKSVGGYVGLKNAGATCYMNSVFQQLYMQPDVRRSILACEECSESERPESVFFQLQAMFGALLGSSLDHYTPQGFWLAYRDYDGLPINLREHQDAFEFFNRLYDQVDETLKATRHEPTLTKIFGGTFAQQVICRGCPHRSEREEPFAAISVDVKNKRNLLESLESFVRGDLLEADNAYYCEECGVKVDALKRVCVKNLPHALVIHLKRFDFDYESMQRLKLKDRFEFPTFLDMKPYTVEGLTLKEMQAERAARLRSGDAACVSVDGSVDSLRESQLMGDVDTVVDTGSDQVLILERPSWYYMYELMGVVVHSGTAFAGHYYSYIKERDGDGPLNCPDHPGGWMAFDDKRVEPYDISDLEKDCFGGKYTVEVYDNFLKTTSPQEFDRPNSAYMLLYERRPQSSEVIQPGSAAPHSAVCDKFLSFEVFVVHQHGARCGVVPDAP